MNKLIYRLVHLVQCELNSLYTTQVSHQGSAYLHFSTEWDASLSQGYPQHYVLRYQLYTPGWRKALRELSVLPKNTTQCPRPGLEPRPLDPLMGELTTSWDHNVNLDFL